MALANDPFGNYLVQKLLQYGVTEQRTKLIAIAAEELLAIALNVHGTRVVQKMVETADTAEQVSAISAAIRCNCMELIRDMNGNHVVQRCLACMAREQARATAASLPRLPPHQPLPSPPSPSPLLHPRPRTEAHPSQASFVYEAAAADCLAISTHRHGCCVMQRCLDRAEGEQRQAIVSEVIRHARRLVADPFGNYVVQYILDLKQPALTLQVARALEGSLAELSLQKFSSNVIEKCLTCGEPQVVGLVARELLEAPALASLLHDPFANYVVQTLLNVSTAEHADLILNRLQPHIGTLRSTLYGKRIQARLLRRFPHLRAAA